RTRRSSSSALSRPPSWDTLRSSTSSATWATIRSRCSPGIASRSPPRLSSGSMQWLRRNFVAGFFVTVPLFISVAALIWIFDVVDGATTPLYDRLLGRRIPGLGTLSTVTVIVLVGMLARNVIGRRVLARGETWLLKIPVFKTIYSPVKQLIA